VANAFDDWLAITHDWAAARRIFRALSYLGPEEGAWAKFVAADLARNEPAFAAYRMAFQACEAGRAGALASLRTEGGKIRTLLSRSGLDRGSKDEILRALDFHQAAYEWSTPELEYAISREKKAVPTTGSRAVSRLTAMGAAKIYRILLDRMAVLTREGTVLLPSDRLLLQAFSKWRAYAGVGVQSPLQSALEFLASLGPDARAKVRKAVDAADKLRAAAGQAAGPAAQNRLARDIEQALAPINGTARNGVAGYLGEGLADKWGPWQDQKKRAYRRAVLFARDMEQWAGGEWEALSQAGDIMLGGKKAWDQAIIVAKKAEKGVTIREALSPVMAAQIKVELDLRYGDQMISDLVREESGAIIPGQILQIRREMFILRPTFPTATERWLLAAGGANYSESQLARLRPYRIFPKHLELPLSRDEFRAVADALISAFVDADLPTLK
jgi:hypothetical protein